MFKYLDLANDAIALLRELPKIRELLEQLLEQKEQSR